MVEATSRRNKDAGARSPSRQGHLWRRRRAAGLVSSQICGSGEGGFPGHGRISILPWSLRSLFWSRRSADAVAFSSAGRGGEGEEGDGTTVFLFRVCVLLVVCGCHVLQFLPAGLGGEGSRRFDVSTLKSGRWWSILPVAWIYCSGIFVWRYCLLFPSRLPDSLKKLLALTPRSGHSFGVQLPVGNC
jgi:hypothetical protein